MYWNISFAFLFSTGTPININMRCIEIAIAELQSPAIAGLTLTWDVLKCNMADKLEKSESGLTLTWDVLK